jgi:hypothetical protein
MSGADNSSYTAHVRMLPEIPEYAEFVMKVKKQSCPCAHCESVWGSGGVAPVTLNQGNGCGEWSASRPGRLAPREGAPDVRRI